MTSPGETTGVVGGNLWDLLKPFAKNEGPDHFRDRRVAIDLSFWLVHHVTAVPPGTPAPHISITFLRTINLFTMFGVYPVFVVDRYLSPLKSRAMAERFFRSSGLHPEEDGNGTGTPQRKEIFREYVGQSMYMLELLGIPVLKAKGEAEALCAQLNSEGYVDACITADCDAFLYGAKCVIKSFQSNSEEPFECYNFSDVEAGLSLKRKQMVAIAILLGNDHNLHGVPGIGIDTALRFVRLFSEDDILVRLCEIGKGKFPIAQCGIALDEGLSKSRSPHCSYCGHLGNKKAHLKSSCSYCITNGNENCVEKPQGFRCLCSCCEKDRRSKEMMEDENWQIKVCEMIAAERNFPNAEIIQMYLCNNHGDYNESIGPSLNCKTPDVESLIRFLHFLHHWKPSYIRQRMIPMLSTIYLREIASKPQTGLLLDDKYEFHSLRHVKVRHKHPYYLVKWRVRDPRTSSIEYSFSSEEPDTEETEPFKESEPTDVLEPDTEETEPFKESESTDVLEPEPLSVLIDDGCLFLLTEENMKLLKDAFPLEVKKFEEKESQAGSPHTSSGVQLSIDEFYLSTKVHVRVKAKSDEELAKQNEDGMAGRKPVKRRLHFD